MVSGVSGYIMQGNTVPICLFVLITINHLAELLLTSDWERSSRTASNCLRQFSPNEDNWSVLSEQVTHAPRRSPIQPLIKMLMQLLRSYGIGITLSVGGSFSREVVFRVARGLSRSSCRSPEASCEVVWESREALATCIYVTEGLRRLVWESREALAIVI